MEEPRNLDIEVYDPSEAARIFGVAKTRRMYEEAIQKANGRSDAKVKNLCMKYVELEKSLGEIEKARGIYTCACHFADPRTDSDFWNRWREFEEQYNERNTVS